MRKKKVMVTFMNKSTTIKVNPKSVEYIKNMNNSVESLHESTLYLLEDISL